MAYCAFAPLSTRPFQFQASLQPEKVVSNHEIAIEHVWLEGRPILHVVQTHAQFQGGAVLRSENADGVWDFFMECWGRLYLGFLTVIRLDQESAITSSVFRGSAAVHEIVLQLTGIERHNYLCAGDQYPEPRRRIFPVLRLKHPPLHP